MQLLRDTSIVRKMVHMNTFTKRHKRNLNIYKTDEILLTIARELFPDLKTNTGGTRHKVLCLWHKEKSPSLVIFTTKSPWACFKCFGCGVAGDVFTLLEKKKRIPFWDALVYIQKRFPVKEVVLSQQELPFKKQNGI